MLELVFLIPFFAGIVTFFLPRNLGRSLLVVIGAVHLLLSVLIWVRRPVSMFPGIFRGIT